MNRILLVDDEEMVLQYLSKRLKKHNYDMVTCLSGEKALEKVKALDFDMVILDVILPGIDGYEVCRRLKSDKKTSGIMVLILSVRKTLEERLKGYEVEADDYITKPYIRRSCWPRSKSFFASKPPWTNETGLFINFKKRSAR
jgi:DNA-binding response OmpR family regulator